MIARLLARLRTWRRNRRFARFTQRQRLREIEIAIANLGRHETQEIAQ